MGFISTAGGIVYFLYDRVVDWVSVSINKKDQGVGGSEEVWMALRQLKGKYE